MQTQSIDTPDEGISTDEFRGRIEHVSAAIGKAGLAGLAAFGDCWRGANVTYFTEFRPLDGVSDIANAVVLLGADQEPTLFVSEQCLGPRGLRNCSERGSATPARRCRIKSPGSSLISTWLFASYYSTWPIAGYIAVTALVSLACVWFLPETYRRDLSADPTTNLSRA